MALLPAWVTRWAFTLADGSVVELSATVRAGSRPDAMRDGFVKAGRDKRAAGSSGARCVEARELAPVGKAARA